MSLPYTISSGNDANAEPIQGNFENLDTRVATLEEQIDDLAVAADTFDNGVFTGGLTASQVSTTLIYTTGGLICNHTYYYKSTLVIDFSGESSDTYYVECDSSGNVDIYTSTDSSRTNLNTVVWNGSGFDSITTTNRNILYGDDQFVVLAGRSGGQTIQGGTGSGENLILESTSNATKGVVKVKNGIYQHKILNQSSASVTLNNEDSIVICDTSSNAITITLPDANTVLGYEYTIFVKTYASGNDVTIACGTGDTFNNAGNNRITMNEEDIVVLVAIAADRWMIKVNDSGVLSTV